MNKNGLLLLDKEKGISSHDAVSKLRRAGRIRKVGHTGTLDPMATGLLILCVGAATRLQSIFMEQMKTYRAEVTFGWATETQDAEGAPLDEERPVEVSASEIESLLDRFRGEIEQIPPAYSAKKIGGRRAYEMARAGEAPDLEARQVLVESFEMTSHTGEKAEFEIRCSAGTYVRTLAHDLGAALGVGAHLSALRRTAIGQIGVEDALSTKALEIATETEVFAAPHFTGMQMDLPIRSVTIDRVQAEKLARGQEIVSIVRELAPTAGERIGMRLLDGTLVAITEVIRVTTDQGPVTFQPRIVLSRADAVSG